MFSSLTVIGPGPLIDLCPRFYNCFCLILYIFENNAQNSIIMYQLIKLFTTWLPIDITCAETGQRIKICINNTKWLNDMTDDSPNFIISDWNYWGSNFLHLKLITSPSDSAKLYFESYSIFIVLTLTKWNMKTEYNHLYHS